MTYTINVPVLGKMEAPDPKNLRTASDRDVLAALYGPWGCVDPVALQVLVDRGLCFRGDMADDIERRIEAHERQRAMCPHEHAAAVAPRDILPAERPCCGTFPGSRHRNTCPSRSKTPNAQATGSQHDD